MGERHKGGAVESLAELLNGVDTMTLLEEAAETAGLEFRTAYLQQTLIPWSPISILEVRLRQ